MTASTARRTIALPARDRLVWILAIPWFLPYPGYDPIRQTVSELAARGPAISLVFVAIGLLVLRRQRIAGVGLVGVGLVPLTVSLVGHALFAIPMLVAMSLAVWRRWPAAGYVVLGFVPLLVAGIGPIGLLERVLFAAWLYAGAPPLRTHSLTLR